MRKTVAEMLRYGAAGVANTMVGYLVFFTSYRQLHLSPQVSNAFGYAIGLLLALLLNRYFVFSGVKLNAAAVMRFLFCFALAFIVNQLVLFAIIHSSIVSTELAQVFAMAVYTSFFYLLNKHVVWV